MGQRRPVLAEIGHTRHFKTGHSATPVNFTLTKLHQH
jgi:hypothetical protein